MFRGVFVCAAVLSVAGVLSLFTGSCAVLPASAQERPIKIVVVDLERVVAASTAGEALQARLAKFQEDVRAEGERKTVAARAIRQRISDGTNSLSEDRLADLQRQYDDAALAIRRFRDDKQREGQEMQTTGLREIEKVLEPVLEKLRDERGYDLIFNNVPGVVVMANQRVDITQLVIDRLN